MISAEGNVLVILSISQKLWYLLEDWWRDCNWFVMFATPNKAIFVSWIKFIFLKKIQVLGKKSFSSLFRNKFVDKWIEAFKRKFLNEKKRNDSSLFYSIGFQVQIVHCDPNHRAWRRYSKSFQPALSKMRWASITQGNHATVVILGDVWITRPESRRTSSIYENEALRSSLLLLSPIRKYCV